MAQKKKTKKSSSFFTSLGFIVLIVTAVVFSALGAFGFFQKLDYRVYDLLLGLRREPKQSEKILFINIDDESIQALGEWPWSHDVIADCLLRIRELGAESVVFDVEYLSPSPRGVAPNAEENMDAAISAGRNDITDVINELSESVRRGFISRSELPSVTKDMIANYIDPALSNMQADIASKIYRDNDDYFARTIQFFGNAWLTVNTRDVAITLSDEDKAYAQKRILLSNVTDTGGFIPRDNQYTSDEQYNGQKAGFSPALHTLIAHAAGAGFTNVVIDSDGTRRRIELLYDYGGKYAAQLSFAPLLHILNAERIERTRNSLIVFNALFPGETERTTVKIPLDSRGRMLINWLHREQGKSFKNESVVFLKDLDFIEEALVTTLSNIRANELRAPDGSALGYIGAVQKLLKQYKTIDEEKRILLARCAGFNEDGELIDGINANEYEAYFAAREAFYDDIGLFIDAGYMSSIEARIAELVKAGLPEEEGESFTGVMKEQFGLLSDNYKTYRQYVNDMKDVYRASYCIIGNTASSTTDLGTNPFTRSYPNVGTHANVMNTILQRDFITPFPWYYGMIAAFLLMFFVMFITYGGSDMMQNVVTGIAVFLIVSVFVFFMIVPGYYIPPVASCLFMLFIYVAGIILRFTLSDREKRFLRRAFSTYLSKDVVNAIVEDPEKLSLGGEDKHITALFSDIKGFSSFSELVTPTQLVSILNEYLGLLSDTILRYNGTIDKYIGDAIVSFFGAPIDLPDHAYRACAAAVRMKQAEKLYNEKHLAHKDIPRALETRIGINTGNMVVGNMGTSMKMNYTIMGNDVNLASRLEGVNKIYKSWILVSETTWNEADSGEHKGELVSRRLDKVRVVGINKPVQLYNILGFKNEMPPDELASLGEFHEALDRYLARDFKNAGKMFMNANALNPADEASLVFAERCKDYLKQGIPDDWDGVMNMTTK